MRDAIVLAGILVGLVHILVGGYYWIVGKHEKSTHHSVRAILMIAIVEFAK
jgi:hypothetical protein